MIPMGYASKIGHFFRAEVLKEVAKEVVAKRSLKRGRDVATTLHFLRRANSVPVERLHEVFYLTEKRGHLKWRKMPYGLARGQKRLGRYGRTDRPRRGNSKQAGCLNKASGYRVVTVDGVTMPVHRVVWAMTHGEWPKYLIDHIDGNRSNNLIENLRLATMRENSKNQTFHRKQN